MSITKHIAALSLSAKIVIMAVGAMIALATAIVIGAGTFLHATAVEQAGERQDSDMRVAKATIARLGRGFRVEGNHLLAGNVVLDGNSAVVDDIKRQVGGVATVFRGDIRVATNVLTPDGGRVVGTPLKPGAAHDALFVVGTSYRGVTDVLGVPHFVNYEPIRNSSGKTIGVLFVGIPTAEFLAPITAASEKMIAIAIVATVLAAIAATALTRRMFNPLSSMRGTMQAIASGNYDGTVHGIDRRDEVGAMAQAVAVFLDNAIAKEAADTAMARAASAQKGVVDTLSTHLAQLAAGDLTATITSDFPDEFALLKGNFNDTLDELRLVIGAVSESAATLHTGSGEIALASEDLARRTEGNAATLEQASASLVQMDIRLRAAASAAGQTVQRADQAILTVGGGRAVADEAVQAMGRVSNSAKGIDSVIEGLDKIAFQTRVLAMNAAVEAGRAGDAGRGFAVVADLVSALAMRAEEEAKRARDQLSVTQIEIVTAVEAVQKVDGAFTGISGDVGAVHRLLAGMAADNVAQSSAVSEITAAVGSMDSATQQNAAMVEETSTAARNLTSEAAALAEQASRFRVTPAASPTRGVQRAALAMV